MPGSAHKGGILAPQIRCAEPTLVAFAASRAFPPLTEGLSAFPHTLVPLEAPRREMLWEGLRVPGSRGRGWGCPAGSSAGRRDRGRVTEHFRAAREGRPQGVSKPWGRATGNTSRCPTCGRGLRGICDRRRSLRKGNNPLKSVGMVG